MENRITEIIYNDEKYIIDKYNGISIAYKFNDVKDGNQFDDVMPIGYFDQDENEIIHVDESDDMYEELLESHAKLRKIDQLNVNLQLEKLLQMEDHHHPSTVTLVSDLDQASQEAQAINELLNEAQERLQNLQIAVEDLSEDEIDDDMQSELAGAEAEVEEYQSQYDDLLAKVKHLTVLLQEKDKVETEEVETEDVETEDVETEDVEAEQEVEEAEQEAEVTSVSDLDQASQEVQAINNLLNEAKERFQNLQMAMEDLSEDEIDDDMQSELASAEAEVEEYQGQYDELLLKVKYLTSLVQATEHDSEEVVEQDAEEHDEFDGPQVKPLDDDDFDDVPFGTDISDQQIELAKKPGDIVGDIEAIKKKAEEIWLYDPDKHHDELLKSLIESLTKDGIDFKQATHLAEIYLSLSKNYESRLKSDDQLQYSHPIVYNYLKKKTYSKYWLIPIVLDIKKVYDTDELDKKGDKPNDGSDGSDVSALMSKDFPRKFEDKEILTQFNKVSKRELKDEIEAKNKLLGRQVVMTDQEINEIYNSLSDAYCQKKTNPTLRNNIGQFTNPDPDLQSYTIHVLRYDTLDRLNDTHDRQNEIELRKSYGPVTKVINKYDSKISKNKILPSTPIIEGPDHKAYVRDPISGEVVNIVGFLRFPINVTPQSLSAVLADIYSGKKKITIYRDLQQIPEPTESNINEIIAVIFSVGVDNTDIEKALVNVVPTLDQLVKIYKNRISHMKNFEQVDQLLQAYDYSFTDLDTTTYKEIKKALKTQIDKHLQQQQLLSQKKKPVPKPSDLTTIVSDEILKDPIIVANYGNYPDFGKLRDSDQTRLAWIHRQPDQGQLFHALMNAKLSEKWKKTDGVDSVSINQQILEIKDNLQSTDHQLQILESTHKDLVDRALELTDQYGKPSIIINSSKGEAKADLSNVYKLENGEYIPYNGETTVDQSESIKKAIKFAKNNDLPLFIVDSLDGKVNPNLSNFYILEQRRYVPYITSATLQKISDLKIRLMALEANQIRLNESSDNDEITKSITKLRFLKKIRAIRATFETSISINLDEATTEMSDVLDRIKYTADKLKYIDENYELNSDKHEYVSTKNAQTICVHKVDLLRGQSLEKYEDDKDIKYCKYCHEHIRESDFDGSAGYDADGNRIISNDGGNMIDANKEEAKGDVIVNDKSSKTVNCNALDSIKKTACIILEYLRLHGQLQLSNDQLSDAIEFYSQNRKINQLTINIDRDSTHLFTKQAIYDRYLSAIPEKDLKKYKNDQGQFLKEFVETLETISSNSIDLSSKLDTYVLVIVSAIIQRELSQPAIYLNTSTFERIVHEQKEKFLNNIFKNPKSDQVITINGAPFIYSIDQETKTISQVDYKSYFTSNKGKGKVFPFLGDLEKITPLDYIEKKFREYYEIMINLHANKLLYLEASKIAEVASDKIKIESVELVEPILVPAITEISNASMLEIKQRLKYLNQQRNYLSSKLVRKINELVNSNPILLAQSANDSDNKDRPMDNKECPTDIKEIYINYLISQILQTEPKKSLLLYINDPALKIIHYNFSQLKEEPNEIAKILANTEINGFKNQIIDEIDYEISKLMKRLHQLELQSSGSIDRNGNEYTKLSSNMFKFKQQLFIQKPNNTIKMKKLTTEPADTDQKVISRIRKIYEKLGFKESSVDKKLDDMIVSLIALLKTHLKTPDDFAIILPSKYNDIFSKKQDDYKAILSAKQQELYSGGQYMEFLGNLGSISENRYMNPQIVTKPLKTKLSKYHKFNPTLNNKFNEIKMEIVALATRNNHKFSDAIIDFRVGQNINQITWTNRNLLKSYIYMTRVLVSIIKNKQPIEKIDDLKDGYINEDIVDIVTICDDKDLFAKYEYILTNDELSDLIRPFEDPTNVTIKPFGDTFQSSFQKHKKTSEDTETAELSANSVLKALKYVFINELLKNFKNVTDDNRKVYCQFILKLFDLISRLSIINDTTNSEIENKLMTIRDERSKEYQKRKMTATKDKDNWNIWQNQVKYGFKSDEDPDPTNAGLYEKAPSSQKQTAEQKLENIMGDANAKASGDFGGEVDETDQNDDEFGDDQVYND
jgi:hypothetical protein